MRHWLVGLRGALALLTILPVAPNARPQSGVPFAWFPLVGLGIGILLALAHSLPLGADGQAFVVLALWVLVTGGLHLDGWADSCDALAATTSPERRLEIMKDPHVGVWAVVGVVILLLGKWIALRALPPVWLIAPPVAGRWAIVLAAWWLPLARHSGSAASFRAGFSALHGIVASFAAVVIISALAVTTNWWLWLALPIAPVTALAFGYWAAARLGGGITGDIYGAICELAELLCLWGLTVWASA